MSKIKNITAYEIKDSRGKPTVEVVLETDKGEFIDSCPSGASTGKNEALELRDVDGRGISKAIENVNKIITPKLKGKNPENQKELDELMIALDGTENKSKLGANAILPVSMALCRAGAVSQKLPLYAYISKLSGNASHIPFPSFNILNGGAHVRRPFSSLGTESSGRTPESLRLEETLATGGAKLEIQEFMVVPQKKSFSENLVLGSKVFNKLTELLQEAHGSIPEMGDEGGYAPQISTVEQALFLIKNAIGNNMDASIALDCAASEFYQDGKYIPEKGKEFSRIEMVEFYKDLVKRFPIISI